jgi:hypothetical protein
MRNPTDLTINKYKDVFDEEFQHLVYFNFGVLLRGIRVV